MRRADDAPGGPDQDRIGLVDGLKFHLDHAPWRRPPTAPATAPTVSAAPPTTKAPAAGVIICVDGYVWPGTTRQGACHGHGGIG